MHEILIIFTHHKEHILNNQQIFSHEILIIFTHHKEHILNNQQIFSRKHMSHSHMYNSYKREQK